jgi:hypothetical protein
MERADAEGPYRQPLDALRLECSLELRRLRSFDDPPGQEQKHAVGSNPTQRERERARRGRVEPLNIVDSEHDRPFGERLQGSTDRDAQRPRIDRLLGSLVQEQRDFERVASRRRQGGQYLVEHALEEIAEHDVGQPAFRLGWSRREDAQPPLARRLDTRKPKRRLPNPRLALEHECQSPSRFLVEEGMEEAEFLLSAHDLEGHPPPSNGDRGGEKPHISHIALSHGSPTPVRAAGCEKPREGAPGGAPSCRFAASATASDPTRSRRRCRCCPTWTGSRPAEPASGPLDRLVVPPDKR